MDEIKRIRRGLLAETAASVGPFEALRENVTDVAQIEQEKWQAYYGVHYGHHFAPFRLWTNVPVTCEPNRHHFFHHRLWVSFKKEEKRRKISNVL